MRPRLELRHRMQLASLEGEGWDPEYNAELRDRDVRESG